MAKPIGNSGPYQVRVHPDGTVTGSFAAIALPNDKKKVEQAIVERFIASMNRQLAKCGEQFLLSDPRQNAENDFDFTVKSPKGDAFLELMEIAPLKGPYDNAPPQY